MRITVSTLARAASIALAAGAMMVATAATAGASVPVDLRVASSDGGNLADVIQYVPQKTTVKTFAGDDCFDPTPPFKQSSGNSYPQTAPTMLSAIWEAGQVEPALQPVRLSDADFASFGALSVCQINAKTPPGFFFLKSDHISLSVGADLFPVQGGERLLAYRTPADFTADEELDLNAPVRTTPGAVLVNVRAYSDTIKARSGATVLGGDAPVQTDAVGNALVPLSAEGIHGLTAVGDYNDIPSQTLTVCVSANPDQVCPDERGRKILGSDDAETLKGTDGNDAISARDGNDAVKAAEGNDVIVANGGGNDEVFCGGGFDTVTLDKGLDKASKECEVVNGAKAKKCAKPKKKKRAAEAKKKQKKCPKKKKGKQRK
jgi:hypothetical protein